MGKRKITIYDIARETGLSPATISRALGHPGLVSEDTASRVAEAAERLGFHKRIYRAGSSAASPEASGDSRWRAHDYLMILPSSLNPFYEEVIDGAVNAARQSGCHLFIDYTAVTDETVSVYLDRISGYGFEGLIIAGPSSDDVLLALHEYGPVVQCSEYNESLTAISSVSIDDRENEKQATDYLISLGCQKLAFVSASFRYHFARRRLEGFRAAITRAGLPLREDWIYQVPEINYTFGYNMARRILQSEPRPDGIICVSDVFAAAIIKTAAEYHVRVPEDIRVVGFDDIPLALSTVPAVTTVAQPRFQIGFNTFNVLHHEVQAPSEAPQHLILPTNLVVRGSTQVSP